MSELEKLVTCLILTTLISIVSYCLLYLLNLRQFNKSLVSISFTLDPDRGLAEQGPLWLSIIIPISISTPLIYFALDGSKLQVDAEGFQNFISACKLPLGIIASIIPLAALISRFHATKQTAAQLVTTKSKNNVDAFYAHRKAMSEYFSTIEETTYSGELTGKFTYHPRLHIKFFCGNDPKQGIPRLNTDQFDYCFDLLENARAHLGEIVRSEFLYNSYTQAQYLRASHSIVELAEVLVLPEIYSIKTELTEIKGTNHKLTVLGTTLSQIFGAYNYARSFLRVLCEFSGHDISRIDSKTKNITIDKQKIIRIDLGDKFIPDIRSSIIFYNNYFVGPCYVLTEPKKINH